VRAAHGERTLSAIQISMGNGRFYGGGLTVSDDAAIDDQQPDLCSFASRSLWRLIALLPALRMGKQRLLGEVTIMKAAELDVRTSRRLTVTADGEMASETPARLKVLPKALKVFVPEIAGPGVERDDDAAERR
jgi:diacylglycerol kinase (ATP)